jgi:hypothetical protein
MRPAARWRAALPLQGLQEGFHDHERHSLCQPQAAPAGYLAAIAVFCNELKGKSALALSRDLSLSYKSAFVLLHKLREAMAEEMRGRVVGGEGKEAEVDGGYFGGYVKPANLKEHRRDRRFDHKPVRQAQGRCHRAGARRAVGSSRVPFRKPSFRLYSCPYCEGDCCSRR